MERLIDLLGAFETFREASTSARGNLDASAAYVVPTASTSRRPAQGALLDIHDPTRLTAGGWTA